MTALKVDLEDAIETLKDLKESTPDRIRRLREEMDEARFDLASQRLLVKWYTWVTQLVEALGPDWQIAGDSSSVDGEVNDGEAEVYIGGEVEFYHPGTAEDDEGFTLYTEEIGRVGLNWMCSTTEEWEELDVSGETAAHVASVINAKIAEVRASAQGNTE